MEYTDTTTGARLESDPRPAFPVAETWPAPQAAQAVIREYEPGSIAAMLQTMFREADERARLGQFDEAVMIEPEPVPTRRTPEAFQALLSAVQTQLKESDAVHRLQESVKREDAVTVHDVEAVFRAYDRAFHDSLQRLHRELTPGQFKQLRLAATSELDWSLRDIITQHVTADQAGSAELRYDPKDFFLLLNPKARKIDYMTSAEILTTLRRSMAQASKEQLKRDLRVIHQAEAVPAVGDLLADNSLAAFENSIT